MADVQQLGFHGKLPSHGDFVRRRVSGVFLGVWDSWLESCLQASRRSLGQSWLDAYLTSPIWRFALSANVCGAAPCTGVLMPSVDAVGRYYPLTLVTPLPAGSCLPALAIEHPQWFASLEELALSALGDGESFDFAAFDQALLALSGRLVPRVAEDDGRQLAATHGPTRFRLQGLDELEPAMLLLQQLAQTEPEGFSLWWTQGSERIAPCLFIQPRLPPPDYFAAMIDGEWARHGWDTRTVRWSGGEAVSSTSPVIAPLGLRSAAISHVGKVREVNEDAWADRPEHGLWVVADGVGGQEAGDMASRSVVEALQSLAVGGELQERLNTAREMLQVVNEHLALAARRPEAPVHSASTVVALFAGIDECCWLWAGDSRLYRLRDDVLECCTRDHSVIQELLDSGELETTAVQGHPQANVITRAVGGAEELLIESRFADLRSGDRYLLCSDGVHGFLDDAAIAEELRADSPQACVDGLLAAVLTGPARDNLTAVVVFVE
ncbi:MAG: type VI secretion system-associated protein TagF [Aquisalimonadaceae bacterium]